MPNPPVGPPGTLVTSTSALIIPNIPKATDLPSSIAAINALAQAVAILTTQLGQSSNSSTGATAATVASGFTVVSQKTQVIRIFDPNDNTVFVDVEQITALTLYDPVTKQTWQWTQ